MAQSKSFFDDVKKEIECPVCQEQFSEIKDPKILKCFHTFCKSCLEGWLRQQGGGALSCPKCRQITECPNNNIASLPSNLFYKQMVDIIEAYSGRGEEDSAQCGNCEERKSLKFYCFDCNCFLCEDCAGLHKKWKDFRGHHVKEIRNFESSDAQDYARRSNVCKQHNDEFRFYCEPCKICICRDCAILDHEDHKKITLEKGLEKKKSQLEIKVSEVQANRFRLRNHKEFLEKRRLKVNDSFEQATKEVHNTAERCINLIRQHETSVTEQLIKQKRTFQVSFVNEMTRLDGKLTEIDNSLEFGEKVLFRKNLPEILNVEKMLERRLQELSVHFEPMLNLTEVKYNPNVVSSLINAPGKLLSTNTEPSLSVAGGRGLTGAIQGEYGTFTVITKDSKSQTTYSEIDQINIEIKSAKTWESFKTSVTDNKNGHYQVMYTPDTGGDFDVSITVRGEAIKGSPFRLSVAEKTTEGSSTSFPESNPGNEVVRSSAKSRLSHTDRSKKEERRKKGMKEKKKKGMERMKETSRWVTVSRDELLETSGDSASETECPICLDTVTNARTLKCKHVFCTECLETALKHDNRCPVCKDVQCVIKGNQPEGQMQFHKSHQSLPGYYDCGTITIDYYFPSGTQGQEHPNPGRRYDGTRRTAYLPANQEGNEVLQLLRRAFDARLVFTVGTSVTTGRQNQVIWNDIHHLTNITGGPQGFGYPDPDYLRRVKEDLAAKGIR
ncbi:E3 ubiquitin-protein ligase TRIM45-like isoform X2 [Oculina patagonica]